MRVVEFRGKRVDNGEWVYGYILQTFTGRCFILTGNDECFKENIWSTNPKHKDFIISDFYEVNENTVGQYTGFKDKNNLPIYENDTIKLSKDLFATVVFSNSSMCFVAEYHNTTQKQTTPLGAWIESYEVVDSSYSR